jgi:predicted MFS family arabinose efflux permease
MPETSVCRSRHSFCAPIPIGRPPYCGFIKSGGPTLVGQLGENDARGKDALYALLYLVFNVGTLLGTVGCAVVGEVFGWRYSFLIAGTAAVAGALIVNRLKLAEEKTQRPWALFWIALLVPGLVVLIANPVFLQPLLGGGFLLALGAMTRGPEFLCSHHWGDDAVAVALASRRGLSAFCPC